MTLTIENLRAKVRVYTSPNCSQCTLTKRLMDRLGIAYVEEDATESETLAALKEIGFLAAPVVVVGESGDDMWQGFRPERINEIAARLQEGK